MKRVDFLTLDEFLKNQKAARGFLRKDTAADDGVEIDAAWRGHTQALHSACAEMVGRDEKKEHFDRLPFTAASMQGDEKRLSELETAERTVEETLADLRTEKEDVKGRMARRAAVTMQIVDAKLADPLSGRGTTDDLRVLSAKPRAVVAAYNDSIGAARRKGQSAKDSVTSVAQDRDRLLIENKVLRGAALTADDVAAPAPAPAPRRGRRTRRG